MRTIGKCLYCADGTRKIEETRMIGMKENGNTKSYYMYQVKCSCGAYGVSGPNRTAAKNLWNESAQFKGSEARLH